MPASTADGVPRASAHGEAATSKVRARYTAVDHVAQAIEQALVLGALHVDGVRLCLNQLVEPSVLPPSLNLDHQPQLAQVGSQPLDLSRYDQLLTGV